ncbi:NADP-dependent oxidoreductase [Lentzea sp. NPDC059081]|uniref:NADP-dependent oxidoreductase n=1 Tax=Lentzea sp. NPDC059081 TaxID=3346719 RepID=UPI0036C6579D
MRALQYLDHGPADLLKVADAPEPHAGRNQIRIAVRTSGVTPADTALRSGRLGRRVPLPHVPGVDAAGVVDEIGEGVTDVRKGDEVFGIVDLGKLGGANADHAVLAAWAPKPAALSWEQAGGAAANTETATRALDLLGLNDGTTLLIAGAAGGVGTLAVQLAVARGVRVIGTAGPATQDFVASLGATPVVYGEGLTERVGEVDAVLHCAGTIADLVTIAGAPDRVLTIADMAPPEGVRTSFMADPGTFRQALHGLADAAALAEKGLFTVPLAGVFPLAGGPEAHRLSETGHAHGKIVLVN